MFHKLNQRPGHYVLVLALWSLLCLPNLGVPSLWEVDEGHNAECAQEMSEADNWVIPTFNYDLRDDKPALLYWLQIAAYSGFGVHEFAARLPSALASLLALLAAYELGRRMYRPLVGLLTAVILASSVGFCAAAHFANPDALLNLCTLVSLLCFWHDYHRRGRFRFVGGAIACGLGVLAKGPVGLVLPLAVVGLFLLWQRRLRRLWDPNMLLATLAFVLTAAPWYVWVAVETKGQWLFRFWSKHHVGRYTATLEGHGGSFYSYYLLVLIVGLAPWSIFLGLAAWRAWRKPQPPEPPTEPLPAPWPLLTEDVRFLFCWIAVYFVFFSLAATKLPNYILPLYPAVALLTARFLDDWRCGLLPLPGWVMNLSLVFLGLIGLAVAGGVLVVGGIWLAPVMRGRVVPGLEWLAPLGLLPMVGAILAGWCLRRGRRTGTIAGVAVSSVLFVAALAAWGTPVVSCCRAPRDVVRLLPSDQTHRDVRLAAYVYFQPSLVFYAQREVKKLDTEEAVINFLRGPLASYLFVRSDTWAQLQPRVPAGCRLLGWHRDLYENRDVLVIANEAAR